MYLPHWTLSHLLTTDGETAKKAVTDGSPSMLSGETDSRSSDPEPEVVLQGLARLCRGQQRRLQLVCSARVSSPSEEKTSGPLSALSITAEKSTADLRSGSESEVKSE